MLKEIKYICGIGRFETARPTHDADLKQCTLIFGENGWGKSTLADLLRSLGTNDAAILAGRRTLDSDLTPKAVLRFSTENAVFENGVWSGARPRVAVYDSAFINDNVFSGDIVSADHLKNQYGLVVGEEGVRRVQRLVELDSENRENNRASAATESELATAMRTVAPPGMRLDDFLALRARPDIDEAIAAKDAELARVRRASEIKAAAEPSLFPVPTETDRFRELLARSVDDISALAAAKVRAHIVAHGACAREGAAAHESWLESGMAYVHGDSCPFCGQPLSDRAIIDAYKEFFGAAYKDLAAAVRKARHTLSRYASGEFRQAVVRTAQQNAGHFRYWSGAAKLHAPVIGDTNTWIAPMEQAAADLDVLFAQKQANLTEPVAGAAADHVLAAWEDARAKIVSANADIEGFLVGIKAVKDSIDPAAVPRLENELRLLQAAKRRHDPDIAALAGKLEQCKAAKEEIAREKKQVRAELDDHGRAITANLGAAINGYLKRLAAGFRIDYREPDYRGKEPSASYNILIREVPVAPRSGIGELDKPSFRNTLSAGDKSTLALAFFLARVNADPKLAETIVVLDDPFTSLDHFRRQFTAIEIKKLCGRAMQVIVLSHDKGFLRLLWDKIDRSSIASLALQTGAPGIATIAPYDIKAATQPRFVTERIQIEEFVEGEAHDPNYIRTRLRTVCEDFYRKGDPSLFHQAASLEEIIRILAAAPPDHPYKMALEDLRDINEYSRGNSHAAVPGSPAEDTSIEELKEFCRRVLDLTRGM